MVNFLFYDQLFDPFLLLLDELCQYLAFLVLVITVDGKSLELLLEGEFLGGNLSLHCYRCGRQYTRSSWKSSLSPRGSTHRRASSGLDGRTFSPLPKLWRSRQEPCACAAFAFHHLRWRETPARPARPDTRKNSVVPRGRKKKASQPLGRVVLKEPPRIARKVSIKWQEYEL